MQLFILCGRVQGAEPGPFTVPAVPSTQSFIMHDRVSRITTFETENLRYVRNKPRKHFYRMITLESRLKDTSHAGYFQRVLLRILKSFEALRPLRGLPISEQYQFISIINAFIFFTLPVWPTNFKETSPNFKVIVDVIQAYQAVDTSAAYSLE